MRTRNGSYYENEVLNHTYGIKIILSSKTELVALRQRDMQGIGKHRGHEGTGKMRVRVVGGPEGAWGKRHLEHGAAKSTRFWKYKFCLYRQK